MLVKDFPFTSERVLQGHTGAVNALTFSPNGTELASGSEDGSLIIWDSLSGKLKSRFTFTSSILSLAWGPRRSYRLYVGCLDGTLTIVEDLESNEATNSVLTGIRAPVFSLAVEEYSGDIAVALGSEIHIAQALQSGKCVTSKIFPPPKDLPLMGEQLDKRVRGRAVAFMDNGNLLVVAYLHHGVVCWDTSSFEQRWQINPIHSHQIIGHAALSFDTKHIALTNLGDGVDIYSLGKSYPDLRIKNRPASQDQNVPVQVSWLSDGGAVVSSSSGGDVRIWATSSGELLQSLEHKGCIVQAIAAFEYPSGTVIAAGASKTAQDAYIRIWRNKIDAPSMLWRATKLYLWLGSLMCRDVTHSVLTMQVRVASVVAIILCAFSFAYILHNVQSFMLITLGPETMIVRLTRIRDFRLAVSKMAHQAALNGVEYLHRRLQDRNDLRNLDRVDQQTDLVVPNIIYI